MSLITLLTDFGAGDGYVGVMKGVILRIAPDARIVDISHEVGPQDIAAGAFILQRAYRYFPPDTIHVAVVDPGVGSARRGIALDTAHGRFVGPDNGLFTYPLAGAGTPAAYELVEPAYRLPAVSRTFHGRDIFAPAAAHLARGVLPAAFGPPIPPESLVRLPYPTPQIAGGVAHGHILYIDHFGNAISDIPEAMVAALGPAERVEVECAGRRLTGVAPTYAGGAVGEPLALISSDGLMEIAIRNGNAARQVGLRVGDAVVCRGGG
jgi:S-adenosyl-L-methionine hydrolase (adenosine-forming)